MYVLAITYNFDGGYVAKKCETYEDAIKLLNDYLEEEVQLMYMVIVGVYF